MDLRFGLTQSFVSHFRSFSSLPLSQKREKLSRVKAFDFFETREGRKKNGEGYRECRSASQESRSSSVDQLSRAE